MDDLVYICTKIARQLDISGLDRVFDAAEAATAAVEEARPLITRVTELVDEVCARPSALAIGSGPAASIAADVKAAELNGCMSGVEQALHARMPAKAVFALC